MNVPSSNKEKGEIVEQVVNVPLSELKQFKNHPFKVRDDEMMMETVASVKEYGVVIPAIVRPHPDGGYELISGHRRQRACELAQLETIPVIIRDINDNQATIIMVDSNLQREKILPSERAFAYKMKLDAIKRTVGRPSKENGRQDGDHLKSVEIISESAPDSARQIQRYIRLTELNPDILDMVDQKQMGMTPAVELSYLTPEEQITFLDVVDSEQTIPSLSQAQRIRNLAKEDNCDFDTMSTIMREIKKGEMSKITFTTDEIKKYFPKSYTPKRMQETIIKLLENHLKNRKRQQER